MDVKIKFLGATRTVTGSRYLVDIGDFRLLFDCGLFQGLKELRVRNWDPFPVDPATINAIIISHAHIDHTGYLPRLVADGFNGPVFCTYPTADLMEIMLLDSAKLQEEEAAYAMKKGYSKHNPPKPLYTVDNAKRVVSLLKRHHYNELISLSERVQIEFHNAGHMLGAAVTEVFINGDTQKKKIVFSGDLGRYNDGMLDMPAAIDQADALVVESTYGDKTNPSGDPAGALARIINQTIADHGVLVIPAFAVGRTQLLLYHLHRLMEDDIVPDVPVYIDSPMATSATYLYYKYPRYHKVDFDQEEFARNLETSMLVFVKKSSFSKTLNEIKEKAIIIASSGMMTGGRILHHLYHRLPNPQDTVLISGYQAEGTRGRKLVDGAKTVRIFGQDVPVRCRIENLTALSGHADKEELFRWLGQFKVAPKITFTVHGEEATMTNYAAAIRERLKWNVTQPSYLEEFDLFMGI